MKKSEYYFFAAYQEDYYSNPDFIKEYQENENLSKKQIIYYLNKWQEKGWIDSFYFKRTEEGNRILNLIRNKHECIRKYENRIVRITWIAPYYDGPSIGIYYSDDYGIKFSSIKYKHYYWSIDEDEIGYIELVENPKTIWRHLNYYAWKRDKIEDAWHIKNRQNLIRLEDGRFEFEKNFCLPECQCKHL